ncbi:Gp37 family protein [Achromobacter insolitus]|uniref:Gp37 family protein n=1 Tax=Achromobacter insolitus TaxID=217204 RepID=UPI001EEDD1A5|nr:Gp37 family protein [Achromobacter insolitus]
MDVKPFVLRLAEQVSGVRRIGGAADLDAALRSTVSPPSLYVMPMGDRAQKVGDDAFCGFGAGDVITFAVLIVLRQLRDAAGEGALEELPAIRREVRKALSGWQPDRCDDPVRFVKGQLVMFPGDGTMWWADEFSYVGLPI